MSPPNLQSIPDLLVWTKKKIPSNVNVHYLYQPGEFEGRTKRAGLKRGFVREELLVVPPNTSMSLCPYASVCTPSSAIHRFVTLFTCMPYISWPSLRRMFIPSHNCSNSASLYCSCWISFSTTFFFTPLTLFYFHDRTHFLSEVKLQVLVMDDVLAFVVQREYQFLAFLQVQSQIVHHSFLVSRHLLDPDHLFLWRERVTVVGFVDLLRILQVHLQDPSYPGVFFKPRNLLLGGHHSLPLEASFS